jgi:hypothetical protein
MTDDDVVMLGTEMAAAIAAERAHVAPGQSPIAGVQYPDGAGGMWRWVECPQDAGMAAFVDGYAAADDQGRAVARASLTMDDLYTVLLFARRRSFAAIRTGDPHAAVAAFDALSVIDIRRVDWRDVVAGAMLAGYAAAHAGARVTAAAAAAIGRADSGTAEVLARASNDDVDLGQSCGYRIVPTATGRVLFEDGFRSYEPDRDLASIALSVAAAIEADGGYRIDALSIGTDLPPIWVGANSDGRVADALAGLTGCASIGGYPIAAPGRSPRAHFLTVYLAEAATADQAAIVAGGASVGGRVGPLWWASRWAGCAPLPSPPASFMDSRRWRRPRPWPASSPRLRDCWPETCGS